MKTVKIFIIVVIGLLNSLLAQDNFINKTENQLIEKDNTFDGRYPEFTKDGKYQYREKVNWFSGFIGGELWNMYDITGNEELKLRAIKHADSLIQFASIDYTHDMGFIFLPTLVETYKRTGDVKYKNAAIKAARMLAKRFNQNGNYIRAWGKLGSKNNAGLMIIDTMMNLELLFWAAGESGDYTLYDIAYKHAITCLNENVRSDYSSFHVVEFNPESGEVVKRFTHQGATDESTWARGQAWGIYGFANAYKYTGDERFLNASKKMAKYFLNYLPADSVPYWDLSLSGDNVPRDASAATIAASGLYLLSDLSQNKNDYLNYKKSATIIAKSVINKYSFLNSGRSTEEGLLIHTVYNYHKGWAIDESYPCGDFYFTEMLNKYYKEQSLKEIDVDTETRKDVLLNDNWFYLEDNVLEINKLYQSPVEWQKVNLPHTWNKFDIVDYEPGYRRDGSWYQKYLSLKNINPNKAYKLYFEGVNISSLIYVNGKKAGGHIGGYVGFEVDITDFITEGENEILVRADNSINKEIIPSQLSDFFIYGGISRDVWLKIIPKSHISKVNISTPIVSNEIAKTNLDISISTNEISKVLLNIDLIDPKGKKVQHQAKNISNLASNNYQIKLDEIVNPILWDIENPNLYIVKIELSNNGKIIDSISETFGYRWYEFREHDAFYLNGKRVFLRGTHRHEEFAGLGNALSNERHRQDIKDIKDMGANFVRLAHYPQDPEVYNACDELGILVWDELPWCRGGVGNSEWKANTTRLFKEQINQNINHPSIIMWSVGNEVYWLPEFENGGDIDVLRKFTTDLNDIAHQLDPGRVTSIRKFYEGSDIVDVFSPSIWSGWYSGVYKNYEKAIVDAQKKYPRFFHAEYGGSSHVGRHTDNPITGDGIINPDEWSEAVNQIKVQNIAQIGDWSESYIVDLFDWSLLVSENNPKLTGNAQWAFRDFGTPLRPENAIPYMNQKGLMDREGKPKDAYYVFKSYWNQDSKFCYIQSHTWLDRSSPENQSKDVRVYSNCSSVELIVNKENKGVIEKDIKKFPAGGLVWNINFKKGCNEIISNGFENGKLVASDTIVVNYSFQKNQKPEEFKLSSSRLDNGNYLISAIAVDKDGKRCLDYNGRVYFTAEGKGKLFENYGFAGRSSIIEMANGKATIEFKSVPFEKSIIEIRNQNFKGNYLEINGLSE
ncbi:MAG: glycoside hydrolase family 88 protein [Bacteroidetes bacterium]|nr:glycoside hydrolase family 88 protein [Bacteroidota bacterium]MBU1117046.1 glycoside hydrolase family 88 protein [Bacteroidota bacterium]MBU1797641.1 glycoside hydrolase family 88 protein [Bacteroidota bacterium]